MDDVKNFSIFVESTENLGILYNDYKKLYKIIDEFLEKIETNIKSLVKNPSEPNDDIKDVVNKFRSDIDIDISHHSIEMDKIRSITNTIKSYRKDVDKLLNRLSSAKDKISFGGNWYRFAINRPKIYYKHIDTDAHEIINKNVRNLNRGLDWVEKIVIDLYNMIDQDLNILTIVDKVYNKKKIYESYEKDIEDNDEYASRIWNWLESNGPKPLGDVDKDLSDLFKDDGFTVYSRKIAENEVPDYILKRYNDMKDSKKQNIKESNDIIFDPFLEANNDAPEYNTDMSEVEAKRTLKTLSQGIINNIKEKQNYKVSQYTANIYANIITKNLLPLWSKGFRKVTITLTSYQSFYSFEFKVPKITQDFVSRFIQGRETINGLIHRRPEINIKMSPRIFHSMETPDDAYNFFKAAIKYYDSGIEKYSEKLMLETMKLNHEMKHLISTTKLSGLVSCPMQLLFVFDDVKMNNKDTFKISQSDIKTINQFIRNIYTRYAAPEKEKKQIVSDLNDMIRELKEYCDVENENIRDILYLPESVNDYLFGKYNNLIEHHNDKWAMEHFDTDWIYHQTNSEVKYLQEKFGVKKLKKIPSDLVAYITIETEAIKDANDKMMISSYCLGKIEIVEWYIELLEVGSKKYIVPHNKPYLENLRTQLLACFKKIMDVKIVNPNSRPIIDIQYPKGYEG